MDGEPVLIAGAGPVGVVTAVALAQRGISVRVFEAAEQINDAPRASTLHPATLEMLSALGLLNDVISVLGPTGKAASCGVRSWNSKKRHHLSVCCPMRATQTC
jgi:2-polyprenyl-6-methoxyphenol hydroxylase-like FAD-dependent oxidoreductase